MEQELLTLPEHLSSPTVLSGVRVTRSLVLCVCLVDRCLSFCTFSFGHYVVCPVLITTFGIIKLFLTISFVGASFTNGCDVVMNTFNRVSKELGITML